MFDLGIRPDNFSPKIFFLFKKKFDNNCKNTYHCHDFVTLIYVLSGSCTYTINNVVYGVKKGDVLICNPGIYHGKTFGPDEEILEVHVGVNNIYLDNLPKNQLISNDICPVFNFSDLDQEFQKCINEIIHEQEKNDPGYDLIIKALVMKLITLFLRGIYIGDISRQNTGLNFESYDKAAVVSTIVSYMNENYETVISLDKLSRNTYLSPVYISKIFKEETGESPINYLINIRLSKAKELLEDRQLSIKAVGEQVGYHDVYHFSKLFKKHLGYSPTAYRELKSKLNDIKTAVSG
jgi:AraC-like DNA-binding protein